jgi:hypothetical protein
MAQFIPADLNQPIREVKPKNGVHFALKELYEILHCDLVEYVTIPDGRVLVRDEEATLPRNPRAGEFVVFVSLREVKELIEKQERMGITVVHDYDFSGDLDKPADYVAGDVLLCQPEEVG